MKIFIRHKVTEKNILFSLTMKQKATNQRIEAPIQYTTFNLHERTASHGLSV